MIYHRPRLLQNEEPPLCSRPSRGKGVSRDETRALGALAFTAQLLKLAHEMEHKVQSYLVAVSCN